MIKDNPYGKDFSWVYNNYSPDLKKYVVDVQWLRWQGHEFRIICNSKSEMIGVIHQLANAIGENVDNRRDGHAHDIWDFETNKYTFSPEDVKRICGDVEILLTPTSLKSKLLLED